MHCPVLKGYEEPQSIFQVIPTAQETSTGKLHKALIIGKEKLKKIPPSQYVCIIFVLILFQVKGLPRCPK